MQYRMPWPETTFFLQLEIEATSDMRKYFEVTSRLLGLDFKKGTVIRTFDVEKREVVYIWRQR